MSQGWSLNGRRALVCGASQGIGRAAALAMASAGAEVLVLARREAPLLALVDEITQAGGRAQPLVADLDDLDGLSERVSAAVAEAPIHVLVHNTGGPPGGPLLQADDAAILHAISRHLLSAQRLVKATLPGMRAAGYGRVLAVLSTSVREPIDNLGVSNLTRSAMASWAKTLSRELPPGVTINCVLPGFVDTERLASLASAKAGPGGAVDAVYAGYAAASPEGRVGRPEELGEVLAFLASPAASFIRGVSIPVDGGRLRTL